MLPKVSLGKKLRTIRTDDALGMMSYRGTCKTHDILSNWVPLCMESSRSIIPKLALVKLEKSENLCNLN